MRILLGKFFIVFSLLYFAGGLAPVLNPDAPSSDEPPAAPSLVMLRQQEKAANVDPTAKNKLKLGVQIGIYLITASLIVFNFRKFLQLAVEHKVLLALLLYVVLSTGWSTDPGFTIRRSLVFIASTSFGIYVASRYTMREILRILCVVGAIAAVASFIVVWRKPDLGISGGVTAGSWQGIFGQKNTLGRFMAFEALVFGIVMLQEKRFRWVYALGALLCLALLGLSRDMSAAILVPAVGACYFLFQLGRKHSVAKMLAGLSAVAAVVASFVFVIVIEPAKLLHMLGKDPTLSGRTDIWSVVWQEILKNPWLGYGYCAFWMGKDGQESLKVWQAVHWSVPHSHNGYLDVLAEVGVCGMLLLIAACGVFFARALRCSRISKSPQGLFPLLYLSFMVLSNCSEGTFIKQESMFWVLFVAIWVLTTRWLHLADASAASRQLRQPSPTARVSHPELVPAWQLRSTNQPV
jgi:exopolysaccharide production protein ExoQ